jgi:hypothetical protein
MYLSGHKQSINLRLAASQRGEASLAVGTTGLPYIAALAATDNCFQQTLRVLEYSFTPQLMCGTERLNLDKLF